MRFRIDLKIFAFLIVFYFTRQIEIYSLIMAFAIIHELGHLILGFILGFKPEKMELIPFGFTVSFKVKCEEINRKIKNANTYELKKIFIAIAGPLTNIIMIILFTNLNLELE